MNWPPSPTLLVLMNWTISPTVWTEICMARPTKIWSTTSTTFPEEEDFGDIKTESTTKLGWINLLISYVFCISLSDGTWEGISDWIHHQQLYIFVEQKLAYFFIFVMSNQEGGKCSKSSICVCLLYLCT
mmetsp:Transcript_19892/g.22529  ORF Transcript_19892/g.22529 Transcript_19892/m.22529 type:complete len:129 (+) Transcript_19892:427-813(+)